MSVHLWVAPDGSGKTAHCVSLAREAGRGLEPVRVCVQGPLQAQAWRRRLAESGGALGVAVGDVGRLYTEILMQAGVVAAHLGAADRHRLLRASVDRASLCYLAPLISKRGFLALLQAAIDELNASRIDADALRRAVEGAGRDAEPLRELADIHAAYGLAMRSRAWVDAETLGILALEVLAGSPAALPSERSLVIVDGYAWLSPLQCDVLLALGRRVGCLVIALSGDPDRREGQHPRLGRTLERLAAGGIYPEPWLDTPAAYSPDGPEQPRRRALSHLVRYAYHPAAERVVSASGEVRLVAAPDRTGEVRAALRWLKARALERDGSVGDLALVARSLEPYREAIRQVAREFGVPVRIWGGLPLRGNPAVAAILDLLRCMLPVDGSGSAALPRRLVLEAWRSPYLDWSACAGPEGEDPIGIREGDAEALDRLACQGCVVQGLGEWQAAFAAGLAAAPAAAAPAAGGDDEGYELSRLAPEAVQALQERFARFVRRLAPPAAGATMRAYVAWLEDLIGVDADERDGDAVGTLATARTSLRVAARARDVPAGREDLARDDLAALRALKELLRSLVWAEEALDLPAPSGYAAFVDELAGAVQGASYEPETDPLCDALQVCTVDLVCGATCRAVALLGLAEGEFPAPLDDAPLLSDRQRRLLADGAQLDLAPQLESDELYRFQSLLAVPYEALLLTRPRLAEAGAPWAASPYWEEVERLVEAPCELLTTDAAPCLEGACSWDEWLAGLAATGRLHDDAPPWLDGLPDEREGRRRLAAARHARQVLARRLWRAPSPHDGDLGALAERLSLRYGPEAVWSPSRLESYRSCPFWFYASTALGLAPRPVPAEGLDPALLGRLYHRILAETYRGGPLDDHDELLRRLPAVATRVLGDAPHREGFRETAWWAETRREIELHCRRTIEALADLDDRFRPLLFEVSFHGLRLGGDDGIRVRGVIDRVDLSADGCVRVIDYKTAGAGPAYQPRAVLEGSSLQLGVYALAAQEALGLGEATDGFYWHVRHAKPSRARLATLPGGPRQAVDAAVTASLEAAELIRAGCFGPHPPAYGCPSYCCAAAFCWHLRPSGA